ncbi:hypothetical protein CLOM_g23806 [Closterium sp. NIES-68]|nr:hypothetical protein CLOM_g23806 [Closterium sp. NIES-68]GJP57931.1 hypothetical protein CLOP_g19048 [Closterium sp. NIES-67]GJP76056.1 hypothetical protein CLOP_g6447 [Closterium sp. NIES-67]
MRDERTTREHRQPVTADRLPDMIAPYRICGCAHPAGLGLNVPVSPWEADLLLHASPGAGSSVTQTRELERACDKDLLSPDVSEAKSKSEGEGPGLSDSYLLAASPAWDEGECERFLSQELGGETELSGKHGNLQTAHAQREPAQGGLEEGETASMEEASSKAMDDYRRRAVVMWAVGEAMAHEVMGGSRGEGTHRQTDTNGTDDGEARMEEHGEHARQHTRWQSHRHTRPLEQRHAVGFDKRVG